MIAKRFLISGRVQGVGFRYFAECAAREVGVSGWVRNLDDGRVEVHANGSAEQLSELAARLRMGPPRADVRGFEAFETPLMRSPGFHIS